MRVLIFSAVFVALLLGVTVLAYAAAHDQLALLAVGALLVLLVYLSLKYPVLLQLKEYERAVVFRFGKFVGVRGPGWVIILPGIESYVRVDLRTQTLDVKPQTVITKDNIEVVIDAVIYLRVIDPAKAVLNVEDYKSAAILFVESTIREVAGRMTASEIISNVDKINDQLRKELQQIAREWGVEVVSVELKNVQLPEGLIKAMHRYREAEQQKLAAQQQAEAERIKIEAVKAAATGLDDRVLAYYYIRALEKIAEGKSTKFILPLEISTLAQSISAALGGAVSPKKVEQDLEGKYAYLLDAFKKMLEERSKGSSGSDNKG